MGNILSFDKRKALGTNSGYYSVHYKLESLPIPLPPSPRLQRDKKGSICGKQIGGENNNYSPHDCQRARKPVDHPHATNEPFSPTFWGRENIWQNMVNSYKNVLGRVLSTRILCQICSTNSSASFKEWLPLFHQ